MAQVMGSLWLLGEAVGRGSDLVEERYLLTNFMHHPAEPRRRRGEDRGLADPHRFLAALVPAMCQWPPHPMIQVLWQMKGQETAERIA